MLLSVLTLIPLDAFAARQVSLPELLPALPFSEYFIDESASFADAPTIDFCSEWNPEFPLNGHRCCRAPAKKSVRARRRGGGTVCYAERWKPNFCADMTEDQRDYSDRVVSGNIPDPLAYLDSEMFRGVTQAYCSVNNGFLARGRRIVPTPQNRIKLRTPDRCVDFGTDPMIGMLEWVGRQVAKEYAAPEYKNVELLVGDLSSPRGGCLPGRSSRKGHASHTNGLDVDLGFIVAKANRMTPAAFHTQFDGKANWWFVKQLFKNPYACIKVIFLDKKHIRALAKAARGDEDWLRYGRFVRHIRSHKNHFHVRIGDGPGQPGCSVDAHPELELDEEVPTDIEVPEEVDANRQPTSKAISVN